MHLQAPALFFNKADDVIDAAGAEYKAKYNNAMELNANRHVTDQQ